MTHISDEKNRQSCLILIAFQSKLFNPAFLRERGLPVPEWMERTPEFDVPFVSEPA